MSDTNKLDATVMELTLRTLKEQMEDGNTDGKYALFLATINNALGIPQHEPLNIDGVEILGAEVVMYGEREINKDYDFGSLTLSKDDEEFVIDTIQTVTKYKDGLTTIECTFEKDDETFPDNKYNMTKETLILGNPRVDFYVAGNFDNEIENITLYVKYKGLVKAINVEQEF